MSVLLEQEVLPEFDGKTYLEVLKSFATVTSHTTGGHPEWGVFVDAINGIAPENGYAWGFLLDGRFIPVGVSTQVVHAGQVLEASIYAWDDFPQEAPADE